MLNFVIKNSIALMYFFYAEKTHHSLNIPVTNGERGGGRYGDLKILNNERGQVKNLSINEQLRHNGGWGGGGGRLIQSKVILVPQKIIQSKVILVQQKILLDKNFNF